MLPNKKYKDANGVEVSIFPSLQVAVTQNPLGTFSHTGAKSLDNSCASGKKKLYAPFDVVCVAKPGYGDGGVFYQSVRPVRTPSGVKLITFYLCHDNNWRNWVVGKTYYQGEHIYTEGTEGFATGVHVHYDVAYGYENKLWQLSTGTWEIRNSQFIDTVFYVNEVEMVRANAPGTGNYTLHWKLYDGIVNPIEEHTVIFNSNGGSSVPNQIVKNKTKVKKPSNPTKEGYRFLYWALSNGIEYNFDTLLTTNLTLHATWLEVPELDGLIPLYMMDIVKGGFNGKF